MKWRALAAALLFTASAAQAGDRRCASDVAAVRAVERAWLDAYESRDRAAMARLLADDFSITHPNARMQTKAEVLDGLGTEGRGPRFVTRETVGRCRRGLVILTGWVTNSARGEPSAARYTDIYVREGTTWRVLASHLSRPPVATGKTP